MSAADVRALVAKAQVVKLAPVTDVDPLQALSKWVVTSEQVNEMAQTRMIWRNLVAATHLAVWSAPGNGGKTSLARFAASELACHYRVLFFQEDASAGDLPALFEHAERHGYQMLNSTLAGTSTEEQVRVLQHLAKTQTDLDDVVMFFDTLKKYTDLMSKGGSRAFFKLMRSLTQLGATVVLLGHTNKHRSVDGKMVFEGVGDVRNDVDELLYLDATAKDASGLVTISIRPDKTRCAVVEASFQLDTKTMEVNALDHVIDVAAILERRKHLEQDELLIAQVRAELAQGGLKFVQLRDRVMQATGEGRRPVERVIERYMSQDPEEAGVLWTETRLRLNNVRHVALRPEKGLQ